MKKLGLMIVLFVAVLTVSTAVAQITFAVGPKAGINFSSISYDPDLTLPAGVTKSGQTGIMFGAAAEIGFANMFAVQLEPTYNQKGDKFEQGSAKITDTGTFLEIPILFKAKFLQGSVKPYAFAGPSIGFVLTSKTKTEGVGAGYDGEVDTKSTTSSTDFAIAFGGGVQYLVAPKIGITGDVRYSLGLSNLNKTAGSTQTVKTRGFQILFGALFHL
jgi:opacity protein-like surface antigen